MRRLATTLLATALAALAAAPAAQAEFGFVPGSFDTTYTDALGEPQTQAGSHPRAQTTTFQLNTTEDALLGTIPDEGLKDQVFAQIEGLVGDPNAVEACDSVDFAAGPTGGETFCPDAAAVGVVEAEIATVGEILSAPVYNLEPAPGLAAKLGFNVLGVRVVIDITVNPEPPFNIVAQVRNISQITPLYGAEVELWGDPSDASHDDDRGSCALNDTSTGCSVSVAEPRAFITMPRACSGDPLLTTYAINSWIDPTDVKTGAAPFGPIEQCETLGFDAQTAAAPSTNVAESPAGFDFSLEIDDPGLVDPDSRAQSDLKRAVVTLPEGFAVNPASAGGLEACTERQLEREAHDSDPGDGCPEASKVATVEVATPLLKEQLAGSIFLAEPYENPLGELLAGYLVIKQPERGILVKVTGKFELGEDGQIEASFDENPQLPFERLDVAFPSGPRAPLMTPQSCGDYEIETVLHPWSGGAAVRETDDVRISRAPSGGACPDSERELPHRPGFEAGSVTPIAGQHSPFVLNLRRPDGSQRFSTVTLTPPAGLTAKLAGTYPCPEPALAAAAGREGKDEQAAPSCPAASRIGVVHAAVGAGPDPYWAPGTAYLAGPYRGAPLSIAILTPALAGPFDLGVVLIRTAVHVNPRTAEITAVSDPIPEFLEGIPLDVRQALLRLDKPQFTLNGTSCEPAAVTGTLVSTLGAPAGLLNRFQLAECRRLGFKPRIALRLFGGVKRAKYQGLRAVVRPRPGDANIGRTVVRFPRSAFIAQENFRTICTRVQFAVDACPKGSVYGRAVAYSPLLDHPLRGNVYLRSSDNTLPDVVADLRGPAYQPIRIELVGRTDSVKGALRNTFDVVPDAPVSYFRLNLFGGRKALIVNSRNICQGRNKAAVALNAQNGRRALLRPTLFNRKCKALHRKAKRRAKQRRAARGRASLSAARDAG